MCPPRTGVGPLRPVIDPLTSKLPPRPMRGPSGKWAPEALDRPLILAMNPLGLEARDGPIRLAEALGLNVSQALKWTPHRSTIKWAL